jgi:hypothetical protein
MIQPKYYQNLKLLEAIAYQWGQKPDLSFAQLLEDIETQHGLKIADVSDYQLFCLIKEVKVPKPNFYIEYFNGEQKAVWIKDKEQAIKTIDKLKNADYIKFLMSPDVGERCAELPKDLFLMELELMEVPSA